MDLVKKEGRQAAEEIREAKRAAQQTIEDGEPPYIMVHPEMPRSEDTCLNYILVRLYEGISSEASSVPNL